MFICKEGFSQQAISSSGKSTGILDNDGTISYTIGQVAYLTTEGMSQGVQKSFEYFDLSVTDNEALIKVYPNPATTQINLDLGSIDTSKLSYELINLNGQMVGQGTLQSVNPTIFVGHLQESVYVLKLKDNNRQILLKKLIKR
ncbi:T9SS type A sorting domain-containing protein [Tamlana fucoidanivorans]|nr:T9SS type A sorting domain-containing protein [Tamlana fucoidanivorans]